MRELTLSSAQNETYKILVSLLESRGVRDHGLAIVGGPKIVQDLARSQAHRIRNLLVTPEQVLKDEGRTRGLAQGINSRRAEHQRPFHLVTMPNDLFQTLDALGTQSPLAIIEVEALRSLSQFGEPSEGSRLILPLSDPQNLGACLRSALAFGWTEVILTAEAASPFLPKSLRAASGATFELKISRGPSLSKLLPLPHIWLLNQSSSSVALDAKAASLIIGPIDLVVGEEGQGFTRVPESDRFNSLKIPIDSRLESLNAVVAVSLATHALRHLRPAVSI
jgi:tRNA G18 (ribose-2'-O)-methylase SpoU